MHTIWYNKSYASFHKAFRLIKRDDIHQEFHLIASHPNPYAVTATTADDFFVEPKGLKGEAYLDWCLETCKSKHISVFIPSKEAIIISQHHEAFSALGTQVLSVSNTDNLKLLQDKAKFYQTVDLPMAPPAAFEIIENIDEFETAYQKLRAHYPKICVKPAISVYGVGFSLLNETESQTALLLKGASYQINLETFKQGLAQLEHCPPLLVMEFLPGHEFSVDCLADQGKLYCAIARKKLGNGQGQLIDPRQDIVDACQKLAHDYQLNGNFNAQFRLDQHDQLRLLEINARLSGGVTMACLAGPNLPYLAIKGLIQGYDHIEIPNIQYGLHVAEGGLATVLPQPESIR